MIKRSCALAIFSLAWMLSQAALAQQSPLLGSECPQALATPADTAPPTLLPELPVLPGMTPQPLQNATYICGACSQAACVGLLSDDECTLGTYVGRCVVSSAWTCETAPRKYCACM
jgi:hypothetical protein